MLLYRFNKFYRLPNLANKNGIELVEAIAGLSPSITSLSLFGNSLNNKSGAELAQAFARIPEGVTSLDLNSNYLHYKKAAELAQAFAGIPAGVTYLDLSKNMLHFKRGAELALAFAGIPAGIIMITLSEEDIASRSTEELIALGKALPHVMKIQVVNFMGEHSNHESANELRKHIGGKIKEAHQKLSAVLTHDVANIIFEQRTGFETNEICSFFHQPKPEPQSSSSSSSSSSSLSSSNSSSAPIASPASSPLFRKKADSSCSRIFTLFHEMREGYNLCLKGVGIAPLAASIGKEFLNLS